MSGSRRIRTHHYLMIKAMNEILRKKIEQAAVESRRASAETLTTFGL